MQLSDWTGGLIGGQDVPISLMRLPSRVYRMDEEDALPETGHARRRPGSLMARVKVLIARHTRITTHELQELLPNEAERKVAIAVRNLVRLKEVRQVGRVERDGQRGSGCGIWEVRA